MEKGSGSRQKLREEIEAENERAQAPSEARWLGGAPLRARFRERKLLRPSVVLAVLGEATAARLCRPGVRLAGLRHKVEPFEETWPDAFCNWCFTWGHVAPPPPVGSPQVLPLQEGPPDVRPPAPHRGAPRQARLPVHTRGGQAQKLFGSHLSQANVYPAK